MRIYSQANFHGFISFLIIAGSSEVGVESDQEQMVSFPRVGKW